MVNEADASRWEKAYLKTRRSLSKRKKRILFFNIPIQHKILDLGCGDGLDLHCFSQLGYKNIIGIDKSENLVPNLCNFHIINEDFFRAKLPHNFFDTVYCNSTLHHFNNITKSLDIISIILKNNGLFCLIEPRICILRKLIDIITFSPFANIIPLLRHRKVTLTNEYYLYSKWLRNIKEFKILLKKMNFNIIFEKKTLFSLIIKAEISKF